MYSDFSKQFNKNNNPWLLYGFVLLFFFSQLSLLNHQIKHIEKQSQSSCLICIVTPNQIHQSVQVILFEILADKFDVTINLNDVVSLLPIIHYSTRAPPLA
jgi:uncharacterized membrane-anchored protein